MTVRGQQQDPSSVSTLSDFGLSDPSIHTQGWEEVV